MKFQIITKLKRPLKGYGYETTSHRYCHYCFVPRNHAFYWLVSCEKSRAKAKKVIC